MSPENTPSEFRNRTHRWRDYLLYAPHIVSAIAFIIFLIMYINTCKDIYFEFKSGNSSRNIEALQDTNKIFGTFVTISGIALLFLFSKQLVNIFMKHKYITSFLITVFSIFIPVLLSIFKVIGNPMELIMVLVAVICGIPGLAQFMQTQFMQSFNKEKREESGIQKNVSNSSPEFIQENSPTTIQENSPTTIQENSPIFIHGNSNSSISIQGNFTTTNQHVTNIVDKRSERDRATADACKMLASKDSTYRISGVKILVNLADSWLDNSDPTCKKDEGKCQDIIDILCAHIRTMPKNCTAQDLNNIKMLQGKKKNAIEKEAEVRQLIFSEIKKRTDYLNKINIPYDISNPLPEEIEPPEDSWGRCTFNFSGAPIFYSLNGMHFPNSNFSKANFYEGSSLLNTRFQKAEFVNATFFEDIKFNNAKFLGQTLFTKSIFKKNVSFYGVHFLGELHSSEIDVYGIADYSAARFYDRTIFHRAEFHKDLEGYSGHPINWQNQDYTLFKAVHTAPRETIEWYYTKFYGYVDFYSSVFNNDALFRDVEFMEGCNFLRSTFKTADFKNSKFRGKIGFQEVTFTHLAYYDNVNSRFQIDSFYGAKYIYGPTHNFPGFAHLGNIPKDKNFDVGIYLYPLGSMFYKILKNGKEIYSQPAKPIEESDNQGETPSK